MKPARQRLTNQAGMTVVEVLVAAAVFMIAFSLLIALVSNSTAKFSIRELAQATNLASQMMTFSQAQADTLSADTAIMQSGIQFSIGRRIRVDNGIAQVRITVTRTKTGSLLADFYSEYALPQQP